MGCKHSHVDRIFLKYNNYLNNKIEAGVIQRNIADNFAIFTALEMNNKTDLSNNYVYNITNYNQLNGVLMNEVWIEIYSANEVNKYYDAFSF